jgi:hypothetical protein
MAVASWSVLANMIVTSSPPRRFGQWPGPGHRLLLIFFLISGKDNARPAPNHQLINAEGRCCVGVPIMQNGKEIDSQGYAFDPEDE